MRHLNLKTVDPIVLPFAQFGLTCRQSCGQPCHLIFSEDKKTLIVVFRTNDPLITEFVKNKITDQTFLNHFGVKDAGIIALNSKYFSGSRLRIARTAKDHELSSLKDVFTLIEQKVSQIITPSSFSYDYSINSGINQSAGLTLGHYFCITTTNSRR